MNTEIQAKIRLDSVRIVSVSFKSKTIDQEITNDVSLSMKVSVEKSKDNKNSFLVLFNIKVANENSDFSLSLEAIAIFFTTDEIDDNFTSSHFAKVNAPAIAFPFIRAYIANFTLNSGFNPIILPSFNFQAMNRLNESNETD